MTKRRQANPFKNRCPTLDGWISFAICSRPCDGTDDRIPSEVAQFSAALQKWSSRRDTMCTENTEADLDRAGMPVARRSFAALAGAGARSEERRVGKGGVS